MRGSSTRRSILKSRVFVLRVEEFRIGSGLCGGGVGGILLVKPFVCRLLSD